MKTNLQEQLSDYLQFCPAKCRSISQSTTSTMVPIDGKYENIQVIFDISALALTISEILKFGLYDQKNRSRSWGTTFERAPFHGKYDIKIYKGM